MKLYNNGFTWQLPGQQDKHADRVEIPTDAAGLCAWLNMRRLAAPGSSAPIRQDEPEPRTSWAEAQGEVENPYVGNKPTPPAPPRTDASSIEDFILNRATVSEVERIFATLGTRFAEARR